jgi:hypothetical protein
VFGKKIVKYDESLAEYSDTCFTSWVLTTNDIAYYSEIITHGPLELARRAAADAPLWELFKQQELDWNLVDSKRLIFRMRNAELMTLGKQLLSNAAYKVQPTIEIVHRDGRSKVKPIGEMAK